MKAGRWLFIRPDAGQGRQGMQGGRARRGDVGYRARVLGRSKMLSRTAKHVGSRVIPNRITWEAEGGGVCRRWPLVVEKLTLGFPGGCSCICRCLSMPGETQTKHGRCRIWPGGWLVAGQRCWSGASGGVESGANARGDRGSFSELANLCLPPVSARLNSALRFWRGISPRPSSIRYEVQQAEC